MTVPRNLWMTIRVALPRGIALFLGLFTLLNLVGELRSPGFDANLWWINLPGNWQLLEHPMLLWSAACFLWLGTHQQFGRIARVCVSLTFGVLFCASVANAIDFYRLEAEERIHSLCPVPFSAIVTLCLGLILLEVLRPSSLLQTGTTRLIQWSVAMTCLLCGLLFPIAQMVCFGTTDYRRRADAIVVFGAKVYEDGDLSSILEERVLTGCELYHEGFAREILFSGGPGVGPVREADGMRRRALELGVPAAAIFVDYNGLDTESTAINTLRIGQLRPWNRILAVSQFYHLPRIKLAFHRQGSEVYTVPARRIYRFRYLPYFMLREIAAWWLYYVRPLVTGRVTHGH